MAGGAGQVRFLATSGGRIRRVLVQPLSHCIVERRPVVRRAFRSSPPEASGIIVSTCIVTVACGAPRISKGSAIGLNAWKTTGNTWTRAALREEGRRPERHVVVGRSDGRFGPRRRPQQTSGRPAGLASGRWLAGHDAGIDAARRRTGRHHVPGAAIELYRWERTASFACIGTTGAWSRPTTRERASIPRITSSSSGVTAFEREPAGRGPAVRGARAIQAVVADASPRAGRDHTVDGRRDRRGHPGVRRRLAGERRSPEHDADHDALQGAVRRRGW